MITTDDRRYTTVGSDIAWDIAEVLETEIAAICCQGCPLYGHEMNGSETCDQAFGNGTAANPWRECPAIDMIEAVKSLIAVELMNQAHDLIVAWKEGGE